MRPKLRPARHSNGRVLCIRRPLQQPHSRPSVGRITRLDKQDHLLIPIVRPKVLADVYDSVANTFVSIEVANFDAALMQSTEALGTG